MISNPRNRIARAIRGAAFAGTAICALLANTPCEAGSISTLYSFLGDRDGAIPNGGLTLYKGGLFGVTKSGGTYDHGAVFRVDESTGAESIIYSVPGRRTGSIPSGTLARSGEVFYGLNVHGGKFSTGTVFSVNAANGDANTIFRFKDAPVQGEFPASMSLIGGNLVGSARFGGTSDLGAIFSLDPTTGAETILHSFTGTDGEEPFGSVIAQSGLLYGTTFLGGSTNNGTAFALDPTTGATTVLYNFEGGGDAAHPVAPLLYYQSILYGASLVGGQGDCQGGIGCGVIFSIDPSTGAEKVLYRFAGGKDDGGAPTGAMIAVKGVFYGTTSQGGGRKCTHAGCGTIFKFNPATNVETVLYAFTGETDGATPAIGALVYDGGAFYGATMRGGEVRQGNVFKFVP